MLTLAAMGGKNNAALFICMYLAIPAMKYFEIF
jgi:hypothetical protein